jgi:hypothetical protein
MMKRSVGYTLFFLFAGLGSYAQNNTSPYSIIGIGDLEKSMFDRTSGMGHAGIALSSNRFLYQGNPASYSKIDEHFFYMEVSSRFKTVAYSGSAITDPTQNNSSDLQFKKITLAIKPKPHWALSFGLLPFSTSNYSFYGKKTVQGSNFTADAYYEGSGSTNQFNVANSFELTKNFSVGVQASYLFGQLEEKETIMAAVSDTSLITTRNIYLGSPYLKLGAQYKIKLAKKWDVSLGATIANKTKMNANYDLEVKEENIAIISKESFKSNYFTVPLTYAGGVAVTYQNAYTLAVDYDHQDWSTLNYKGLGYSLVNSQKIAAGFEYSQKINYMDQAIEKYFLQTGFFYSNSYLKIAGQQLKDVGATFGAGVQLNRSGLGLQGSIEVGQRGTTVNNLVKEKYTQVNFTISYRDFWLSRKMKKYN